MNSFENKTLENPAFMLYNKKSPQWAFKGEKTDNYLLFFAEGF